MHSTILSPVIGKQLGRLYVLKEVFDDCIIFGLWVFLYEVQAIDFEIFKRWFFFIFFQNQVRLSTRYLVWNW